MIVLSLYRCISLGPIDRYFPFTVLRASSLPDRDSHLVKDMFTLPFGRRRCSFLHGANIQSALYQLIRPPDSREQPSEALLYAAAIQEPLRPSAQRHYTISVPCERCCLAARTFYLRSLEHRPSPLNKLRTSELQTTISTIHYHLDTSAPYSTYPQARRHNGDRQHLSQAARAAHRLHQARGQQRQSSVPPPLPSLLFSPLLSLPSSTFLFDIDMASRSTGTRLSSTPRATRPRSMPAMSLTRCVRSLRARVSARLLPVVEFQRPPRTVGRRKRRVARKLLTAAAVVGGSARTRVSVVLCLRLGLEMWLISDL